MSGKNQIDIHISQFGYVAINASNMTARGLTRLAKICGSAIEISAEIISIQAEDDRGRKS